MRGQLATLHLRILSQPVDPDAAELDPLFDLWSGASDPEEGWRVVLTAMLQDPALVLY